MQAAKRKNTKSETAYKYLDCSKQLAALVIFVRRTVMYLTICFMTWVCCKLLFRHQKAHCSKLHLDFSILGFFLFYWAAHSLVPPKKHPCEQWFFFPSSHSLFTQLTKGTDSFKLPWKNNSSWACDILSCHTGGQPIMQHRDNYFL